ncbi:MAG: macro domain-containing protein [Anaerolinea sp.]|nr:macro domain-containing protein [Anaerolinea sp.]
MITYATGNILKAQVEALVNTVNCVGIMGKGIALQFKQAFPENYRTYARACELGEVQPGHMLVTHTGNLMPPHYIINFPTKRHWRSKSRLEDIETGLDALAQEIQRLGIHSIAVPALGCGNGGLDWNDVRPRIEQALGALPGVEVLVFAPEGAPAPGQVVVAPKTINLTRARALLVLLLDIYHRQAYSLSRLEIQKLAYFLQAAGEPLKLDYDKHEYGPYAHNLNHILRVMEGKFISGYGDGSRPSEIRALPAAVQAAKEFLANDASAQARLQRIEALIDGFETPYGLELLATVHWVGSHDAQARTDVEVAIATTQQWNERKKQRYQPYHIQRAWERLAETQWLE